MLAIFKAIFNDHIVSDVSENMVIKNCFKYRKHYINISTLYFEWLPPLMGLSEMTENEIVKHIVKGD